MNTLTITEDEWAVTFLPEREGDGYKQYDWRGIQRVIVTNPECVWTVHDDWSISQGYHVVNRAFHVVTQHPAPPNTDVLVKTEVFDCEDEGNDHEWVGEDCLHCLRQYADWLDQFEEE